MPEAPHTGDGLFEGEVIEVVQVSLFTLGRGQVVDVAGGRWRVSAALVGG